MAAYRTVPGRRMGKVYSSNIFCQFTYVFSHPDARPYACHWPVLVHNRRDTSGRWHVHMLDVLQQRDENEECEHQLFQSVYIGPILIPT
jgi:hypothetical protein